MCKFQTKNDATQLRYDDNLVRRIRLPRDIIIFIIWLLWWWINSTVCNRSGNSIDGMRGGLGGGGVWGGEVGSGDARWVGGLGWGLVSFRVPRWRHENYIVSYFEMFYEKSDPMIVMMMMMMLLMGSHSLLSWVWRSNCMVAFSGVLMKLRVKWMLPWTWTQNDDSGSYIWPDDILGPRML